MMIENNLQSQAANPVGVIYVLIKILNPQAAGFGI
jgi:hypothetical protein